jgi:mannose-6-phosphate isomerase
MTSPITKPRRIEPRFLEKIWGTPATEPWFDSKGKPIGEVWFQDDPPLPLLTKFIFTSQILSVQVHPDDAHAQARGLERGKTEMWHVLRADPGAQLGLGFRHKIDAETARRAALDGSIVDLIHWIDISPGESYLVPAGTVHALGAGLVVCEIQQTSDTTYRLFDYGRGRELQLDESLAVAELDRWHPEGVPSTPIRGPWKPEIRNAYFDVSSTSVSQTLDLEMVDARFSLYIFTSGEGKIGTESYRKGECWLIEGGPSGVAIEPAAPTSVLRAFPVGTD